MARRSIASAFALALLGSSLGSNLACGDGAGPGIDPGLDTDDAASSTADSGDASETTSAEGDGSGGSGSPLPPEGSSSGDADRTTTDAGDDTGSSTGGPAVECPQVRVLVAPGASLNVRPSPSTTEEPVGGLANGEIVDVLQEVAGETVEGSDLWFQIASADLEGFVSARFTSCTIDECVLHPLPDAEYLAYGLHPDASDALRYLRVSAGTITQTIGDAPASAGTHAVDGTAEGHDYSCATDLSVSGLGEDAIHRYIADLAAVGYAGWYRKPGADGVPGTWSPHIHAVWVGAPMKASLRDQVRSWVEGGNGLATEAPYQFHEWPQCLRDAIWERFVEHNPE